MRAKISILGLVGLIVVVAVASSSARGAEDSIIFFEDFDSYPAGANLSGGGYGGWTGRWGGNITVSSEEAVSSPHSAKMDNNLGCWESGLYHLLPSHPVIWFSADIMGRATGRMGCHSYDVHIWLNNPDDTGKLGITLESREEGGYIWGTGLVGFTWWSTGVMPTILEPGYPEHVGRWINVMAKLDNNLNQADFWVDGIHRATLPVNPAYPLYNSIVLGCGEGLGYVDNIMVFTEPLTLESLVDIDPDTLNLKSTGKWITCYIELPEGYDVADIDVSTIMLNEQVAAESRPTGILDHDGDGVAELMVKFSRSGVQGILGTADQAELTVTGELADGTLFEGADTIKVVQ